MRKKLLLGSVLFAFVFSLSVMAQIWPSRLKLEFKGMPGEVNKYAVSMLVNSEMKKGTQKANSRMKVDMLLRQKVMGVSVDGTLTVSTVIEEGTSIVNGQKSQIPNVGQTMLMKITRRGQIANIMGDMSSSIDYKSMQITFPDRELKVGDSWESQVKINPKYPIPMKSKYTIKGFKVVNGHKCVIIESDINVVPFNKKMSQNLKVKAKGHIYFDYEQGKIVANDMKTKMYMKVITNGPGQKERSEVEMNMGISMKINLL
jgi:hypothetical protein